MRKLISFLCFVFTISLNVHTQEKIKITAQPETIYVESGENKQVINFDFIVSNKTADTLSLSKISLFLYDSQGRLIHSRFLDGNGTAPAIQVIPNRTLEGISTELLFNPFTEFTPGLDLSRMEYEFSFLNRRYEETIIKHTVSTQSYHQKITYSFPLHGRILVYDAHDLNSHHRRFNYEFPPIKALGIQSNFMRYAYDFVILDGENKQSTGNEDKAENYIGYGKGVYAVAPGKVIYASNKHEDDKTFNIPELKNNPLELYGNCIAVQHDDNSISIYGHLKKNSLKVIVGDNVKGDQQIASIGISGSSFFPHLHFELRNAITHNAEGLPAYFPGIYLLETKSTNKLKSGLVETGNIISTIK